MKEAVRITSNRLNRSKNSFQSPVRGVQVCKRRARGVKVRDVQEAYKSRSGASTDSTALKLRSSLLCVCVYLYKP
jgi:hypothetical protein